MNGENYGWYGTLLVYGQHFRTLLSFDSTHLIFLLVRVTDIDLENCRR